MSDELDNSSYDGVDAPRHADALLGGSPEGPATMTSATISYDSRKFEELLLYIAEESVGDPKFGKTKLNKILYYVDFSAYGSFGKSVTGAEYQRRPYGPVPRQITAARNALLAREDAAVEVVERFGYPQERLVAKRPPNLSLFSNEEKQLVDDVIKALWDRNGSEASELSHRELGWKFATDGALIPYSTVFLSCRPMNSDDIQRGHEIAGILERDPKSIAEVEMIIASAA
ncbi:Panacea domain-containing protein [Pseudonocardia yunnanensis]|uniref:Panacea domain-containing protein n=1 Tax=Pseudonocardia yunnanensis TaxID=58107 RepID=A0ABW4EQM8_9PSEU